MLGRFVATALVALVAIAALDSSPAHAQAPTATPTAIPTATPTPGPWPIFQHDPRHTGRSQFPGPARVGQLWSYDTGTGPLTGSPIVGVDGTVYIGGGGYLHALS